MKRNIVCFGAVLLAAVAATQVHAAVLGTWGDFQVLNDAHALDAWIYARADVAAANPVGFPAPLTNTPNGDYVPTATDRLTVGRLRQFYAADNHSPELMFRFENEKSSMILSNFEVTVGSTVLSGENNGMIVVSGGSFGLLASVNLSNYNNDDRIRVQYSITDGYENLKEIRLASTPEPISMAFLGSGLLGMILARTRLKKRRV